jgi:hypothetical protein
MQITVAWIEANQTSQNQKSEIKKMSDGGFDDVWFGPHITLYKLYKFQIVICGFRDVCKPGWIEANQTSQNQKSEMKI